MCKFIGWNIADGDCKTWGNCGNVKSKTYVSLTHSTDLKSDWFTESNVQKKDDYTNRWIFPTGVFETENGRNTAQKNIYDVAGNVWEWTTEIPQYSESNVIIRGGSARNTSLNVGTTREGIYSDTSSIRWYFGFRIVLYVE